MYDAIIVGAGPAGSTAAKNLADAGASVALLDKDEFPRNKPCGGGLTPHLFERHPEIEASLENHNYAGTFFVDDGTEPLSYSADTPFGGYVVRALFDQQLADGAIKAGAEFFTGERAKAIGVEPDRVVVETNSRTFVGRVLLGADGVNSVVAKRTGLNPGWPREELGVCLRVEEEFPEDVILEYFGKEYRTYWHVGFGDTRGYAYIFPKKRHINIGFGTVTPDRLPFRELMLAYIDFCEEKGFVPKFREKQIGSGTYPLTGPLKKFTSDRVLLLGDAAGFVNPLNGEGIHYAIWSGDIAADVIVDALATDDLSAKSLSQYSRRCMKSFGKYLRRCRGLQKNQVEGMRLIMQYGRESVPVLQGISDIVNEKFDPRLVFLKMNAHLFWEVAKSKVGIGRR